jgi:hypothetical protein
MNVVAPMPEPTSTETPAPAPAPEAAPPKPPLVPLLRTKAADTLVTAFASLRTYEKIAVEKTIAWLTAADAKLTQALTAGEQFLVGKLRA